MITAKTYEKDWITTVASQLGKKVDLKLLEKVIYAFTLLEQLKLSGLDFIFKGGTSLLLLSANPRRFSIDIDIIADYDPNDIPAYLDRIVAMGRFSRWVDDNDRNSSLAAPVAHYKFYYSSQIDSHFGEEPILLDLLFGKNPYPALSSLPIEHSWLQTGEEKPTVQIPVIESILGDKLTAFAPTTTGILYSKNRPVEMIKQLYDVGFLFDEAKDFRLVKDSYLKNVEGEIRYRNLTISWKDVLQDTYQAALLISGKNVTNENYALLQKGISNIVNFILEKFNMEDAIVCSAKAAYLTEILRRDETKVKKYSGPDEMASWSINADNKLNKLKKTNPEAFYYWYQIFILDTK